MSLFQILCTEQRIIFNHVLQSVNLRMHVVFLSADAAFHCF